MQLKLSLESALHEEGCISNTDSVACTAARTHATLWPVHVGSLSVQACHRRVHPVQP